MWKSIWRAARLAGRGSEEFGRVRNVLDELPAVEPSFGFDARVRQRVAAEPRPKLVWMVRAAGALCVFGGAAGGADGVGREAACEPSSGATPTPRLPSAASSDQDFDAIKDLGVLENYDVLTKFDALSESSTTSAAAIGQVRSRTSQARMTDGDNVGEVQAFHSRALSRRSSRGLRRSLPRRRTASAGGNGKRRGGKRRKGDARTPVGMKGQPSERSAVGLPPKWVENLRDMPPDERERFLENNEKFKSLAARSDKRRSGRICRSGTR